MNTPALRVEGLSKQYPLTKALDELTLDIPEGEVVAIVGPDGAGKTTLLRILAGILDYDAGSLEFFGENFNIDFERKKASIGYMPQRFGLYEDLTVQENIDFFADLFTVPRRKREERITRLLAFSRMEQFRGRLAGALSGGMKQKLGLACALIHNPRLLLLDEPTNGVDPVSRREFWKLLYDLNSEGSTIVVSSSYMDEAERANRFALIRHGKVIAVGEPHEARNNFSYNVYEYSSDSPRKAKEAIIGANGFTAVNLFGNTVHILTQPDVEIDQVRDVIDAAGLDRSALNKITPSFEDIYIGLSTADG